jgi:hypothetical protein
MARRTGHCLCGAVSFTAEVADAFQACHCTQCQRWTGGGPFYAVRVREMNLTGETGISAYHHSEWGERATCATCGSIIYWRLQGRSIAFMAVGLLTDQAGLRLTEEIFVDDRPDWLPPHVGAEQRTEAEMKAQLAAFLEKERTS